MEKTVDILEGAGPLGQLLVAQGYLRDEDIPRIEGYAGKKNIRFGEAALRLKLIQKSTLERAVALQFDYPVLDYKATGYSKELVAAYEPFSDRGEAIRRLRTKILMQWDNKPKKTLAVVSPEDKRSATWVAANLAIAFSQLGHSSLLVDANLKKPILDEWFNIDTKEGLSSLLVSRTTFEQACIPMRRFRDLTLLPAGAIPPNPPEVLARRELKSLLSYTRNEFDVTIVDAPSFTDEIAAEMVCSECHEVLLVVSKNRTSYKDASNMIQLLGRHGASIVGAVVA